MSAPDLTTTPARLGGRTFPDIPACVHCQAPVRVTNYALGPQAEHYDPDASFPTTQKGTAWRACRGLTVATLPAEQVDKVVRA